MDTYVFTHIKFIKNHAQKAGGAIFAHDSTVGIKSRTSVIFSGNIGYKGGALALIDDSFIKLKAPIKVYFLKNHAEHSGGAIYVKDYRVESFSKGSLPLCFFQIEDSHLDSPLEELSIMLENNTAQHAGSALYGGWVDYCQANIGLLDTAYGTKVF